MKLLPNVYQVSGPSLSHRFDACAYLLPRADGTLALIDCGTPEGYNMTLTNIRALGFDPMRVTDIYATHGHYDHVGAASLFRRDCGARLHLHALDRRAVETADQVRTTASLLYGSPFPKTIVDESLKDNSTLFFAAGRVSVLHTPGHSPGSCCFVLAHDLGMTLLIAADTLHGGYSDRIGSDTAVWRRSLDRLCDMHFDWYVMGHSGPMLFADADRRLQALRQSFDNYHTPWFKDFYRQYDY